MKRMIFLYIILANFVSKLHIIWLVLLVLHQMHLIKSSLNIQFLRYGPFTDMSVNCRLATFQQAFVVTIDSSSKLGIDCLSSNVAPKKIHSRTVFRFLIIAVIQNYNSKYDVTIVEGTLIFIKSMREKFAKELFSTKYPIKSKKWPDGHLHCCH